MCLQPSKIQEMSEISMMHAKLFFQLRHATMHNAVTLDTSQYLDKKITYRIILLKKKNTKQDPIIRPEL